MFSEVQSFTQPWCICTFNQCFGQILFNLARAFAAHLAKSFVPAFFVPIDHLFDNLESGKRNYHFGEKSQKSREFWIQKSLRTLVTVGARSYGKIGDSEQCIERFHSRDQHLQIYGNKRKCLHKNRDKLPQDWFGTQTWPPFYCFGTPVWPPWRHLKTLYYLVGGRHTPNATLYPSDVSS